MLALIGAARRWEPKRLRLRLFTAADRLASSGRRLRLRLSERWPWADDITAATARLQTIPTGGPAGTRCQDHDISTDVTQGLTSVTTRTVDGR